MPAGGNAQTLAYQYEKVLDRISVTFHRDHILFDKIEKREVETISSRAMRIPLDLLAGGKFRQINPDGGDAGRGSAITANYGQLSTVAFAFATEFTKLMESATDSKEKAVEPAAKRNLSAAIDQMRKGIEALLNTAGDGVLDTIVSVTSPNVINVNNASQFYDNQDIQIIIGAVGGNLRGVATILSVDTVGKTLTLTTSYPAGTAAGDSLMVDGAPNVAAGSLLGVEYHQNSATNGTWLQLDRTAYPGKLTTPNLNFNSAALTPQKVRLMLSLVQRALGIDDPTIDNLMWHLGLDMQAAWENVGLIVTQVIQNQLSGTESEDMLKKTAPKMMADRPILLSNNAQVGRIDGLCLKHWGRGETQPIGPLEFGGQTMFPAYGASGGLAFSTMTYLWTAFNIFTDNPRAGVFGSNIAVPAGY